MEIFVGLIMVLFVPTCFLLPLIILLQDSKGEGLSSSAFGGSSMQSILGGRGAATFLSKVTTWLAIGFMAMALFLMRFYGEKGGELKPLQEEKKQSEAAVSPAGETEKSTTGAEVNKTSDAGTSNAADAGANKSEAGSEANKVPNATNAGASKSESGSSENTGK